MVRVNPITFRVESEEEFTIHNELVTSHMDVKAWATFLAVDRVDIFEYRPHNGFMEYKFFIRWQDYTDEIQFIRPETMDDAKFLDNVKQIYEERVLGRLAKQSKAPKKLQHVLDFQDKIQDMMGTLPSEWPRDLIEDLNNGK